MTTQELQERTNRILVLRDDGHTYREIGEMYGISPERVRQIEHKHRRRQCLYSNEFWREIRKYTKYDVVATRVLKVLLRNGIRSIEELKQVSLEELWKCRNYGMVCLSVCEQIQKGENR